MNWRFLRIRDLFVPCVFSPLPDTRQSWNSAAKTGEASAEMRRLTPGLPKKTKCASISSASTKPACPLRQSRGTRAPAERDYDDEPDEAAPVPADLDARVKELCAALAEAERGGHAFIALKWFRDSFLPRKAFRWNQHPESRQAVLAEAIQRGVVLTSKIANPKTPAYPTTTIRLNRAEAGVPEEAQRFHPVTVQGESITDDIHEERGKL